MYLLRVKRCGNRGKRERERGGEGRGERERGGGGRDRMGGEKSVETLIFLTM